MNKAEGTSVGNERFSSKNYFSFFEGLHFDFVSEILSDPFEIGRGEVGQSRFEESFMFIGDCEVGEEFPDSFKACEDSVLSSEWMFPEEHFKGSFIFMLVGIEIRV